jgi:hypothetical protein
MAKIYIKFPTKFFDTKEWQKPRKYTKTEAYLWLLNNQSTISVRHLATSWQWSKSQVERFIAELKAQKLWDTFWDTFRDTKYVENKQDTNLNGTRVGTPFGTHLIENIINPPILSSTKVESNIIPPKGEMEFLKTVDFSFRKIIEEWFAYKRERKESYKSSRSMQAFLAKLKNISQNNPDIAQEIILQSMANNWAGIFELKQQNNEKRKPTNQTSNAKPSHSDLARAVAEGFARANTPQGW